MALGRILHLERSSGTFRSIFPSLCYLISVNMPKGGGGGFYAVRKGTVPGVYLTWDDCQQQTKGFSGARYKKFTTQNEAEEFIRGEEVGSSRNKPTPPPTTVTYTGPSTTYTGPAANGVPLSRAIRTENTLGTSTAAGVGTQPVLLSPSDLVQMRGLSDKLCNSISVVGEHLTEGNNLIRQLRVNTAQFPGRSKDVLRSFDDMLLQAQNQLHSLESLVAQSKGYCRDLETGKRSRSTSDDEDDILLAAARKKGSAAKRASPPRKTKTQADSQQRTLRSAEIYTDGCCHNNGRKNPCAGIGVYWGPNHPNNTGSRLSGRQTNNRAEIEAARTAIEQAKNEGYDEVIVYTDSQFLINCITKWIDKWKKNGWKLANGNKVINRKDIEQLEQTMEGIMVQWKHVRGHAGIPGNEAADKLANDGARLPYIKPSGSDEDDYL